MKFLLFYNLGLVTDLTKQEVIFSHFHFYKLEVTFPILAIFPQGRSLILVCGDLYPAGESPRTSFWNCLR
jgi:hypothetical protein